MTVLFFFFSTLKTSHFNNFWLEVCSYFHISYFFSFCFYVCMSSFLITCIQKFMVCLCVVFFRWLEFLALRVYITYTLLTLILLFTHYLHIFVYILKVLRIFIIAILTLSVSAIVSKWGSIGCFFFLDCDYLLLYVSSDFCLNAGYFEFDFVEYWVLLYSLKICQVLFQQVVTLLADQFDFLKLIFRVFKNDGTAVIFTEVWPFWCL